MATDMATDEYRVEIPVPQVTQKHSWDCGLACAVTVLRYFEKDSGSVYDEDLKTLGCGESVWTVDLAHLMALHKIRHHLCTTFIGVDKSYSKKSFYARNFTRDEERVNKLFEEAESHGISLEQRSVPLDDIYGHLRSENIIIVLVDWEHLECIWCDIKICPRLNCFKGCCGSYQGHYVVVCGADTSKGHIYYMNPAYKKGLCCSRAEKFDIARKSHGTDEDILFLYKTNHLTDPKLEGHR